MRKPGKCWGQGEVEVNKTNEFYQILSFNPEPHIDLTIDNLEMDVNEKLCLYKTMNSICDHVRKI